MNPRTIQPMLINKIPAGKEKMLAEICNNGEYFGEIKIDGCFYEYEKDIDGDSYLFSRSVSKKTGTLAEKGANVPHIMDAMNIFPPDTVVIGEVYFPGKSSKDTVTIMGCLPEKAIERQKNNPIHYYIYDIIYYDGYDLTSVGAETRYNILAKLYEKFNLQQYPFIRLAEKVTENLQEAINKALANGEEGMVLKRKEGLYYPGKRPAWETIKIKKVDYIDAVITAFDYGGIESTTKEPETWQYWAKDFGGDYVKSGYNHYKEEGWFPITKWFYLGYKTTLIISAYDDNENLVEVGRIKSGLSDETIIEINEIPKKYIGQVASFQCMELDSKEHTLRHAFYKQLRPDKNAKDCTLKAIFR